MIDVRFVRRDQRLTENIVILEDHAQITAQSVIRGTDPSFTCHYKIICTPDWQFREIQIHDDCDRRLLLRRDAQGHWFKNGGEALAHLSEAQEVDFVLTPFTNTLPIKRLKLAEGQSADIITAWIDYPSLEIKADPQRYTCLSPTLYRYESRDSDFTREITVDENGLLVEYPGLFRRA